VILVVTAAGAVFLVLASLVALWQLIAPTPVPLARRVEVLHEPPTAAPARMRARWQHWALRLLGSTMGERKVLEQNLAVCGETMEHHSVVKLGYAVSGAALPTAMAVIWGLAGITAPVSAVVFFAAAGAVAGFVLPDVSLRRRAQVRRREFRYALSLFLELVVITLSGGAGVHEALRMSASTGTGWAFQELRLALRTAFHQATSPWHVLMDLGQRLGSDDLIEVASSVELASTRGAPPEDALAAKAEIVGDHELSDMKAEATAASERMGGPMIVMFAALILLIGFPAFIQILAT
jgi:tight adherence protein C